MGGKKAGGGFMGIGGKSGFLNTGLFGTGPEAISGFEMTPEMMKYEKAMLERQNAIASGQAPSIAQMQMNQGVDQSQRAALAFAASQRGASNPALGFRQAQIGNQQAQLEGAQQAAILAEQERRQAEQLIAAQAAAQRGVAFNQASTNIGSKQAHQSAQLGAIVGIGQSAAKASAGGGGGGA